MHIESQFDSHLCASVNRPKDVTFSYGQLGWWVHEGSKVGSNMGSKRNHQKAPLGPKMNIALFATFQILYLGTACDRMGSLDRYVASSYGGGGGTVDK